MFNIEKKNKKNKGSLVKLSFYDYKSVTAVSKLRMHAAYLFFSVMVFIWAYERPYTLLFTLEVWCSISRVSFNNKKIFRGLIVKNDCLPTYHVLWNFSLILWKQKRPLSDVLKKKSLNNDVLQCICPLLVAKNLEK